MSSHEPGDTQWGGRLWLLVLTALLLTVLIVVLLYPRPLAWTSPAPTVGPEASQPGLFQIPTVVP
jgi:hypothetical protein